MPEPIAVDLELVPAGDDLPTFDPAPEAKLCGVSLELAYAVFEDAITAAQSDSRVY